MTTGKKNLKENPILSVQGQEMGCGKKRGKIRQETGPLKLKKGRTKGEKEGGNTMGY